MLFEAFYMASFQFFFFFYGGGGGLFSQLNISFKKNQDEASASSGRMLATPLTLYRIFSSIQNFEKREAYTCIPSP